MSQLLIVDGHNAILGIPELRDLHNENSSAAREQLTHWLSTYQDTTSTKVILVYDGNQKERRKIGGNDKEILTIYAERGTTADFIIESLVQKHGKQHHITVATNDLSILHNITAHHAHGLSLTGLEGLLHSTLDQYREKWNF